MASTGLSLAACRAGYRVAKKHISKAAAMMDTTSVNSSFTGKVVVK